MRAGFLLVFVVLVSTLLAGCGAPATPAPATEPPAETPAAALEERLYAQDAFSITIPAGWGMTPRDGEYFDLGMQEQFTLHNAPLISDSGAFCTLSSAPLAAGEDLARRVASAYAVQKTAIEEMVQQPYERDGISGLEAAYRRPWGEPWWRFRDVWFEKDGTSYLLSCMNSPNTFDQRAEIFDAILASFHFND